VRQVVKPGYEQCVAFIKRVGRRLELLPAGDCPLSFSLKIFSAPASVSWPTCVATLWPSVDTLGRISRSPLLFFRRNYLYNDAQRRANETGPLVFVHDS
jgi:hypothetical protein